MGKIQQFVEKKQEKNNEIMAVLQNYVPLDNKNKTAKTQLKLEMDCSEVLPENVINLNGILHDYHLSENGDYKIHKIKDHYDLENCFNRAGVFIDFVSPKSCERALSWRTFSRTIAVNLVNDYSKISKYPSYPEIPGELVLGEKIAPEKTGLLDRLIDFFLPLTEMDRVLMKAHMCTPAWGGGAGKKPCFVVAGPDGIESTVQIGKSTYANALQKLYESYADLHPETTTDKFISALLEVCVEKVVRIDNLRGKLPSGVLERCITSEYIFGHKMHIGHRQIPNLTCWTITANMPKLEKDLATRSHVVRLKIPDQGFIRDPINLTQFINEHRKGIIADILYVLAQDKIYRTIEGSRFPEWDYTVLNKFVVNLENLEQKTREDRNILTRCEDHLDFKELVLSNIRRYYGTMNDPVPGLVNEETHSFYITRPMMFEFYKEFKGTKNLPYTMPYTGDVVELCDKIGWKSERARIYKGATSSVRIWAISEVNIIKDKALIESPYHQNKILKYF